MTRTAIAEMMADLATELNCSQSYYQFDATDVPSLPFFVWYYDSDNSVYADNTNYAEFDNLVLEFYSEYRDFEKEDVIKDYFIEKEIPFAFQSQYISEEKMYETAFLMDILIEKEN